MNRTRPVYRLAGLVAIALGLAVPAVVVVLWLAGQEVRREEPVARADGAGRMDWGVQAPDGPHRELFVAHCVECHSAKMTFRKPLSSAAWRDTIERMIATHGAKIPEDDIGPVVEYLLSAANR